MSTEYIFLKGKGSWVNPTKINEWGKRTMVLHPDSESLDVVRALQSEGVKNVIGKDDDGYYVRLARPANITIKGKITGMEPPTVFDGSKPLPGGGYAPLPSDVYIGNGSDVIVKMEVYTHNIPGQKGKKAKAMRWNSIRVDNLIEYKKTDFDDVQNLAAEGYEAQPKQLF